MAGLNKGSMFSEGIIRLHNGAIDFDTDVIRAALMKTSFANTTFTDTFRDSHDFFDDIPDNDQASTTYKVVSNADIVQDDIGNNVKFADGQTSLTYPTVAGGTKCRGIVVFRSDTGGEASSELICYAHFSSEVEADGGTVTVNIATDGIFKASYD